MDQLFFGRTGAAPTREAVLGGVSLVIWTITVIVAIKYAILVLRAQNDGEGGLFALYGLLHEHRKRGTRVLLWALMVGAGLLFGDGMITPAISVISAVEGLQVAAPTLGTVVIPIKHRSPRGGDLMGLGRQLGPRLLGRRTPINNRVHNSPSYSRVPENARPKRPSLT